MARISVAVIFIFLTTNLAMAGVNIQESIMIGGIRQWITIKGVHDKDPIILFLHGGPGSSAMKYADQFTSTLQQKFLVVQWDQRRTGQTKKLNDSRESLTLALYENDVVELINYLRTRFAQEKIYLMGHSWGGFLTLYVAARHGELLVSCFAISPMVWQLESERQTLEIMKQKAIHDRNKLEMEELSEVTIPFASGKQLYLHRKWLASLMDQKYYSQSFVEAWASQWLSLFNEASMVDLFQTAPRIACPVTFMVGDHDYQTWFELTKDYYEQLDAPQKELIWFANAAHSFLVSDQKKLQEIIIHWLLSNTSN